METLHTLIARHGALKADDAVGWTVRLLKQLVAMHEAGQVHGRISAKAVRVGEASCRSDGLLIGARYLPLAPHFCSPEVIAGGDPTAADDTWAAGVLLFHALTAGMPFPGRNARAVRERIDQGPAEELNLFEAGAHDLGRIMARVLARDATARLSSATELHDALVDWHPNGDALTALPADDASFDAADISGSVRPSPPPRHRFPAPDGDGDATAVYDRDKLRRRPAPPPEAPAVPASQAVVVSAPPARAAPAGWEAAGPRSTPPPSSGFEGPPSSWSAASSVSLEQARLISVGLVVLLVGSLGSLALWLLPRSSRQETPPASSAPPAPPPAAPDSARAVVAPAASSAPALPRDPAACITALLPGDAFGSQRPDLGHVCEAPLAAYRGSVRLKTDLVRGGAGQVTEAMRIWSRLGWFEMAAFAVLRGRCCPGPAPLEVPALVSPCKLDDALAKLGQAARAPAEMDAAIEAYVRAADCVAASGAGDAFGRGGGVAGGERAYFDRLVTRLR